MFILHYLVRCDLVIMKNYIFPSQQNTLSLQKKLEILEGTCLMTKASFLGIDNIFHFMLIPASKNDISGSASKSKHKLAVRAKVLGLKI